MPPGGDHAKERKILDEDIGEGDRLGRVQSLVRAFGLLDTLAKSGDGLTLTEIASVVKLPRSTAHRLLTTMDALRYVEFDNRTNRWMIGVQAITLGSAFVHIRDIGRLGRPIMRSLMIDSNEVVNIGVSDQTSVRYVGQVRPLGVQRDAADNGTTLPMHTTASGKVLLAHWADDQLSSFLRKQTLVRRTRSSIVEERELVRQLAEIRTRGYAVDDQENSMGRRCVAVPVFNCHRQVRASLSITGGIARMPDSRLAALGHSLAGAAARMTSTIGSVFAA